MAPMSGRKRGRAEDEVRRPKKKVKIRRKQTDYHSSSEEDDEDVQAPATAASKPAKAAKPVPGPKSILKQSTDVVAEQSDQSESELEDEDDADELERNTALNAVQGSDDDEDDGEDEAESARDDGDSNQSGSEESGEDEVDKISEAASTSTTGRMQKKRNDPAAFANSISKILSTKLTTSKRPDPVLSRSKAAADTHKALAEHKSEQKARSQLQAEKKAALQKGRVVDVLGLETPDVDTGKVMEEEKRLKKIAQRGVVKLFNAVRAAQVRAEEARKGAREEGVVGMKQREERVNEMSKEGFLDLISKGGKGVSA